MRLGEELKGLVVQHVSVWVFIRQNMAQSTLTQRGPEALISDVLNGTHRSRWDMSGELSTLNLNPVKAIQVRVNTAHLMLLINTYLTAA